MNAMTIKIGRKVDDRKILGEFVTEDRGTLSPATDFVVMRHDAKHVVLVRVQPVSCIVTDISAPMPKSALKYAGSLDMGYRQYPRYCPA
jgi:hypothetical protein